MATEADTTLKTFHSPDRDMALQSEGRFGRAESLPRKNNLTLQAFAGFEWLFGDAIESFAAEIFRHAFGWRRSRLSEQPHGPMYWKPLPSPAITG
jgi:hypothetical protein